jgi:SAM-dependent methyltransferase
MERRDRTKRLVHSRDEARRKIVHNASARNTYKAQVIFEALRSLSGVGPTSAVLDVGCGPGRITRPFMAYLVPPGRYVGLDVRETLVRELQATVGSARSNFEFIVADVQNEMYNPGGKHGASAYRFPFDGETFDLVFLYSVFTHMLPAEVENYLSEIARVLKRGGRCVISYFLLNGDVLARLERRDLKHPFPYDRGSYRLDSLASPEDAVAYDERLIRNLYGRLGLSITSPTAYGTWCREVGFYHPDIEQDLVAARRD